MSSVGLGVRFSRELRDICGAQHLIEDPADLKRREVRGVTPAIAVDPASPDEIAAVLRLANEHALSVVPAGGFTQQHAGHVPGPIDVLLETSRLLEVEHYDPGDLTIGIGAGCTVAQLDDKVARDGLLFAGDAPLPERATIGGLLASGLTGPLRHGYGGLRDFCIGIRFVTGDGRKGKGGGRVVKNVAGYDMMKLLIGSWGTLAVVTSASFKLFPAPRQTRTFVAEFASATEAIAFRDHVLHSPLSPICLELVSPGASEPKMAAWSLFVRAAGSDVVLARYRTELGAAVSREIEGAEESAVWRRITDYPSSVREADPQCAVMALSLPLTEVLPALTRISTMCESSAMRFGAIGRIGVGHLLVSLWPGTTSTTDFVDALSTFRNQLPRDASMAVLSSPGELQQANGSLWRTPTHRESMHAVKQALDPQDILNRGRFRF